MTSLRSDKLLRSDKFFSPLRTVKDKVFPRTEGYDIHFQIAAGEDKEATELRKEVTEYIDTLLKTNPGIYFDGGWQTGGPIGPWRKPMWELKLTLADSEDPKKHLALHQLMKQVAEYAKSRVEARDLQGSLLVHANQSDRWDMRYEYDLHVKHALLVRGEPVVFNNIWAGYLTTAELRQESNDSSVLEHDSGPLKNHVETESSYRSYLGYR